MADNKAVAYVGAGKVEVQTIDYPTFELQDGPGVNPDNGRPRYRDIMSYIEYELSERLLHKGSDCYNCAARRMSWHPDEEERPCGSCSWVRSCIGVDGSIRSTSSIGRTVSD